MFKFLLTSQSIGVHKLTTSLSLPSSPTVSPVQTFSKLPRSWIYSCFLLWWVHRVVTVAPPLQCCVCLSQNTALKNHDVEVDKARVVTWWYLITNLLTRDEILDKIAVFEKVKWFLCSMHVTMLCGVRSTCTDTRACSVMLWRTSKLFLHTLSSIPFNCDKMCVCCSEWLYSEWVYFLLGILRYSSASWLMLCTRLLVHVSCGSYMCCLLHINSVDSSGVH